MDWYIHRFLGWLVERALAQTGRFAIWIVTFGKWRAEHFENSEAQTYAPEALLHFTRRGENVITEFGCMLSGIAFYVAFGLGLYALSR